MADSIDFRELNSAIAELNRMLVSLGPALFQFRGNTLGGAEEVDRFKDATKDATDSTREFTAAVKDDTKTKKELTNSQRLLIKQQRDQKDKQKQVTDTLEPYRREVKYHTDGVKQGQRAQRDLTAAFRGLGGSLVADVALGVQRFGQVKNLVALEQVKIDQYQIEHSLAQQELATGQERLQKLAELKETAQSQVQAAKQNIALLKEHGSRLQADLEIINSGIEGKKARLEATNAEIAAVQSNIAVIQAELQSRIAAKDIAEQELQAAQSLYDSIIALDDGSEAAREAITDAARGLVDARSKVDGLSKSAATAATGLAALEQKERQLASMIDGQIKTLQDAEQAQEAANSALQTHTNELQRATDRLAQTTDRVEALKNAHEQQESKVKGLTDQVEDLTSAMEDAEGNIRNMKIERIGSAITGTANFLDRLGGNIKDLGYGLRDFKRRVGISAGDLAKMAFTDTGKAINLVKGKWQEMVGARGQDYFDRMIEARDTFGDEFGGTLTGAAAGKLASQARSMGVTVGELAKARRGFMTLSMGELKGATDAQGKFIAEFKKKGLNTKDAFEAVSKYSDIMARNGGRFAASFAKAAADAKKIGVDLKKVDAFGDSVISDYEGFLEKQAELGAMGFQFDSTKLAELAESGDTGALMNELRSQLAGQGKDLSNLRRSEQLALSNAFGINFEEMMRLAQPKAEEGTKKDALGAAGEAVAKGLERIDKATLNLPDDFTAAGYAAQFLAKALNYVAPIIMGGTWLASKFPNSIVGKMFGGGATAAGGKVASTVAEGTKSKLPDMVSGSVGKQAGEFGAGVGKAGSLGAGAKIESILTGIANGMKAFANPQVAIGGVVMAGIMATAVLAIGAALAGATWLMGKALPTLAEGLKSFNQIDGMNLAKVGLGLLSLSLGMLAFGPAMASVAAGAAIGALTSLMLPEDGIIEHMVAQLKKFGEEELPLSKIQNNATAIVAYAKAMAAYGAGNIGQLVGFIAGAVTDFWAVKPPIEKMQEFANLTVDAGKIKNNAEAMTAFGNALSSYKGTGESFFSKLFGGGDIDKAIDAFKDFAKDSKDIDAGPLLTLGNSFKQFNDALTNVSSKGMKSTVDALNAISGALVKVNVEISKIDITKLNKIKELFTPNFTAAFTASIVALANLYQGKKVEAGAITKPMGDGISRPGYGERTLVTPGGVYPMNNSDTVVAYANDMIANDGVQLLSKGALLNNQPSRQNVIVDMTRLEQKLDAVVRAIGGMQVNLDGNRVGRVLVTNAEIGAQVGVMGVQSRTTY